MKTKTKAFILLLNEIHNNNIFDLYNTFLMFYNFFKLFYIFLNQFLIFTSKNIIYKFKKLPYLDRLILIKNITYKLEELNIVYVKVFQSLCLDKNILNEKEREFLLKYTDSVPYSSNDINYELLDILESKYNICLDTNNNSPINSGIVGIVFKGTHNNDNKKVVIKILKNNIEERLNQVFNEIEFITNIIKYIPYLNNLNFNKLFLDNKESLLNQINFVNEVKNIKLFKEKNKNLEEYIIPYVYEEITNDYNNIIVMENIEGLKIDEIKKMDPQIKNEFGKLFVKFGMVSILYNSAIHNDLHSGNIFFYINDTNDTNNTNDTNYTNDTNDTKPKYQLGLIDFGICVFPNRENQNVYYTILYEMLVNQNFNNIKYVIKNIINESEYFEEMPENLKLNLINESIKLFKQYKSICLDAYFLFLFCKNLKKYKLSITKECNEIFFGCFTVNALANELLKLFPTERASL